MCMLSASWCGCVCGFHPPRYGGIYIYRHTTLAEKYAPSKISRGTVIRCSPACWRSALWLRLSLVRSMPPQPVLRHIRYSSNRFTMFPPSTLFSTIRTLQNIQYPGSLLPQFCLRADRRLGCAPSGFHSLHLNHQPWAKADVVFAFRSFNFSSATLYFVIYEIWTLSRRFDFCFLPICF